VATPKYQRIVLKLSGESLAGGGSFGVDPERVKILAAEIAEGKPEKMADKIVEGRLNKFYEEVCLYEQPFIKDNTTTVADLIKTRIAKLGENISVSRFVRFKVGGGESGETAAAE